MVRINTNVSSLIAQRSLARNNQSLQTSMERLSTGLQINKGADNPAGLIVSERLRSEVRGVTAAIENAERAANVIATAEAALDEVANLLLSVKGLAVESANEAARTFEEIRANQLQIDSAVDSITRIANATSFAGLKLLDGSIDYVTSGVPGSAVLDVDIFQANFGTNPTFPVTLEVLNSAERAALVLSTGTGTLPSAVTLEVAGNDGITTLQLVSGMSLSAVVFAVNTFSDSTGVQASLVSGAGAGLSAVRFQSVDFGSEAFVSVRKVPGTGGGDFFETYDEAGSGPKIRDEGLDVTALVNGNLAEGRGTDLIVNTTELKMEMKLDELYAQTVGGSLRSFTITGGGTRFQLGPRVQSNQQVGFGIQSIAASRLGDAVVGFLSSIVTGGGNSLIDGKFREASDIIDESITQVAVIRGRLGAFERNTLQTNARSMQIALENLSASESRIRDTDFAKETSNLTRDQVLVNVGTSILSTANNSASTVLGLLQ